MQAEAERIAESAILADAVNPTKAGVFANMAISDRLNDRLVAIQEFLDEKRTNKDDIQPCALKVCLLLLLLMF